MINIDIVYRLRDLNLQDKADLTSQRKQNEDNLNKIKTFTKEIETLKSENNSYMNQIVELKDQVS